MRVAYVRCSSIDQNEARQTEGLAKYDIEKWYIEKVSGKNMDRPKLQELLEFVREGDTVYIHDFSRLARSTKDLLELVSIFQDKKVQLISNKENLDTSTPTGKLMLTMIAAINEFERENLLERQREGVAIAKEEGKYKGRQKVTIDEEKFMNCWKLYQGRHMTKVDMAAELNISRPTLDRLIKDRGMELDPIYCKAT